MRITDLLSQDSINLNFSANSKPEAIDNLVDLMMSTGNISDKEEYKKAILAREELSTTGIGEGIAIPHAKVGAVKKATLVAAVSKDGIDYEALDGAPSNLFFMIAAPDGANNTHLDVLSRLSTILMDGKFRESLINSKDNAEFLKLIDAKETEKFGDDTAKEEAPKAESTKEENKGGYQILAVTACPTGIAHTYMAAEALQNKADELGITCKVETNGSSGIKNALTKEDIENATCIIVAADKNVEMTRFDGKKVIITKVANGIHKATELVTKAAAGDAPVYHASEAGNSDDSETATSEGLGRQLYKHLMNGVSHMLPFVIGGGLLIAIAFLIDSLLGYTDSLGSNSLVAAWFNSIGGAAFGFMLPVLAGYIAMSIGERPALAVGFVGGALANAGGSGFLGALVAGFAAGYLMVGLKVLSVLPQSLEGLKPTLLYPLLGIGLIGAVITFIINPPVAFVNGWLTSTLLNMGTGSAVFVGILLAAMMAIDMGGPFNKAAYVVGIAALEAGNTNLMAAVMIGGMVPPLAIAICTTFFKNRFTQKERESGIVNYVMGLSFITEGAIPFAASDPAKVIPACVIGSGIAGALAMFFDCTLNAPHGGIFVLPVIGHPLMYFVSLAVGSIVGAIILGFLKKPLNK